MQKINISYLMNLSFKYNSPEYLLAKYFVNKMRQQKSEFIYPYDLVGLLITALDKLQLERKSKSTMRLHKILHIKTSEDEQKMIKNFVSSISCWDNEFACEFTRMWEGYFPCSNR